MSPAGHPKYFIAKHDLCSLEVLPRFIWNTEAPKTRIPRGYRQIKKGDRWVSFAYTTSDKRERRVSLITGFFECVKEASFGKVSPNPLWKRGAWIIAGKHWGPPLRTPVVIPPVESFLSKRIFNQATINRISRKEFQRIEAYARRSWFDPKKIPLLERAPRNEQELLAVVVYGHKKIGIEEILRVQTAFPDMQVKIKGKVEEVYLELELYSKTFRDHEHQRQIRRRRFKGDGESKPVAVLCWIDDDRDKELRRYVHRVYELQALIREGRLIRW